MMAYSNGYVVSVIHNEKSLRETNEEGRRVVRLPFESEYKIRLKSRSKMRTLVTIEIDGTEVLNPGAKLVLKAGESFDLERFVGSNLNDGSRFKFRSLEKGMADGSIQDPWSPENGKVVVKFWEELSYNLNFNGCFGTLSGAGGGSGWGSGIGGGGGILRSSSFGSTGAIPSSAAQINSSANMGAAYNCSVQPTAQSINNQVVSDAGGTVDGSHSDQKFQISSDWFPTNSIPTTIEIWLKGTVYEPVKIQIPVKGLAIHFNDKGEHEVYLNGIKLKANHLSISDGKATIKAVGLEITDNYVLI